VLVVYFIRSVPEETLAGRDELVVALTLVLSGEAWALAFRDDETRLTGENMFRMKLFDSMALRGSLAFLRREHADE
jgi:hypothetical protein